jgi:hypothetical protein
MREALLLILALAGSCLGFACFALSMQRHWENVTRELALPARRVAVLRAVGCAALAASLVLALLRDGPTFGSVLWVLVLTVGAVAVAFTLTWRPFWLLHFTRAAQPIR